MSFFGREVANADYSLRSARTARNDRWSWRPTALLLENLALAVKSGAMKLANTRRVIVDTTGR